MTARVALTKTVARGSYAAYTGVLAKLTFEAASTDKNTFAVGGNDLVIAHNTTVGALTVTINSVPDPMFGRTGDITTYSIPASEYAVFGPFKGAGWAQSGGVVNLEASAVGVEFAVIALP
jgi:hypothetical protein